MGKTCEVPQDLRNLIVAKHSDGIGYKRISKLLEVPVSTVGAIIRKWKEHHITVNRPRTGAPRKLSSKPRKKKRVDQEPTTSSGDLEKEVDFAAFLLLNEPPRMVPDNNVITRRLLDLTLEILHLVTGEDYTVVKKTSGDCGSGGWSQDPIIEIPPHSLIHERDNRQKILELTNKITELLLGEELGYIEGYSDLYKNVMMEDQQPVTSQDGSSRKGPAERCPHPLYSQDSPEEKQNVVENHQVEGLTIIKVEEEDPEEMMRGDHLCRKEVDEEDPEEKVTRVDPVCKRELDEENLEEERMRDNQPYKREVEEEGPEEMMRGVRVFKREVEEEDPEEERMRCDHTCKREVEEIPVDATAENLTEQNFMMSTYKVEDEDVIQPYPGENFGSLNVHPEAQSTDLSNNRTRLEEPSAQSKNIASSIRQKGDECIHCGKQSSGLFKRRRLHTGEKPYSCSECETSYADKHERQTGDRPFSCSRFDKSFNCRSDLDKHQSVHTVEGPHTCSDCGRRYKEKSNLFKHQRIHTGGKLYSCSECGKCCTYESDLIDHQKIHTGEKPYPCYSNEKSDREKPFS